jgi:hypothetical protein
MAITINYLTKVINVPQADLTFVSGTLYELDIDTFRRALNDIADSEEGITEPDTHIHNTEVTIVGDIYARQVIITNGYSVEFEDGQYTVKLVGANTNVHDVAAGILVQNQVQVIPTNAAGLIRAQQDTIEKLLRNKQVTDPVTGKITIYDDDNTTKLLEGDLFEDVAGTQPYRGQGADRRDKMS